MEAFGTKTLYDIVTRSADETISFGRKLAAELRAPCLVLLEGELGSGKTTLTKGIVAGLGAGREEEVTSPTFTLVHEYGSAQAHAGQADDVGDARSRVFHVDLYRIEGARDAGSLGLEEMFDTPSIVLIEWGDKLAHIPGVPSMRVRLESLSEEERRIRVES